MQSIFNRVLKFAEGHCIADSLTVFLTKIWLVKFHLSHILNWRLEVESSTHFLEISTNNPKSCFQNVVRWYSWHYGVFFRNVAAIWQFFFLSVAIWNVRNNLATVICFSEILTTQLAKQPFLGSAAGRCRTRLCFKAGFVEWDLHGWLKTHDATDRLYFSWLFKSSA